MVRPVTRKPDLGRRMITISCPRARAVERSSAFRDRNERGPTVSFPPPIYVPITANNPMAHQAWGRMYKGPLPQR